MSIVLESERLVLRQFTEADVDNLVRLDSDPAVMRYLTGGEATPRAKIEQVVLPRLFEEYSTGPRGRWAAEARDTGEFLGWLSLAPVADPGEAGLGYRFRSAHWGRGFATEGSRALLRMAFTELGLRRVFADTMAVNTASRRVMERVGMTYVRTYHLEWDDPIDGTEHGEVEYEIVRDDWLARNRSGP
ncbi:GNAT family N-acetyltransferase [Amycolatopsis sp. CA-230715]|uniref:GNAT family N-acetyltransferase n=1 Tax=Amycolatopsis sp. CA-230715 TaxID=2745196 RepID=UPI001C01251F|nr:GNAT family N-acetyltransferase [Amycolatopsis sp. CA-230715]QWF84709.1 hypothetical protein HUW46_08161 [Amycolatopsis sp. CA-230715]